MWTDEAFAGFAAQPGVGTFLIIKKGCKPGVEFSEPEMVRGCNSGRFLSFYRPHSCTFDVVNRP